MKPKERLIHTAEHHPHKLALATVPTGAATLSLAYAASLIPLLPTSWAGYAATAMTLGLSMSIAGILLSTAFLISGVKGKREKVKPAQNSAP